MDISNIGERILNRFRKPQKERALAFNFAVESGIPFVSITYLCPSGNSRTKSAT